jgi:type VI protein secretion system component Hcp
MKKLLSLVALAFCLSVQSQGVYLLVDGYKGPSTGMAGAFDLISMGSTLDCNCEVTRTSGMGEAGKIVFNMKNDVIITQLRNFMFTTKSHGDAYFVFTKAGSIKGAPAGYYYVKLVNYTVMGIAEATDSVYSHNMQVSLGYQGIIWTTFSVASPSGVSFGWDFLKNVSLSGTAVPGR